MSRGKLCEVFYSSKSSIFDVAEYVFVRVNEILTKSHRSGSAKYEGMSNIEDGKQEDTLGDTGLSHRVLTETTEGGGRNQDLWMLDGVDAKTRWCAIPASHPRVLS
jgi:hypothetical protein